GRSDDGAGQGSSRDLVGNAVAPARRRRCLNRGADGKRRDRHMVGRGVGLLFVEIRTRSEDARGRVARADGLTVSEPLPVRIESRIWRRSMRLGLWAQALSRESKSAIMAT